MDLDPRRIVANTIDALAYAAALTGVVFLLTASVSVALGGGLPGAKWLMFFLGFLMLGYASLKLRPRAAWKQNGDGDGGDGGLFAGSREPVGVEKLVGRLLDATLPPSLRPVPSERPSSASKLFLAAVGVLATSFVMEVVFAINY